MTRRDFLHLSTLAFARANPLIGACDWSLGYPADFTCFEVAYSIGLRGVQLSFNSVLDPGWLARIENLETVLEISRKIGVQVPSLAIGELNRVPLKSEEEASTWVSQAIDSASYLGAKTVLLPFFGDADLRKDTLGKYNVIKKLKPLARKAESLGIVLALESYLSADEHLNIIREVNSRAVKVYYDPRNATDAGYNIFREIKQLGTKHIAEIHLKENGFILEKGTIDWPLFAKYLKEIGYAGWYHLEWAKPDSANIFTSYAQNLAYIREVF